MKRTIILSRSELLKMLALTGNRHGEATCGKFTLHIPDRKDSPGHWLGLPNDGDVKGEAQIKAGFTLETICKSLGVK